MRKFSSSILVLFIALPLFGAVLDNLKVSPTSKTPIATSAIFEGLSTTKGVLFPRMTSAQRTAISSPANGLMVFDTDLNTVLVYTTGTASWNYLVSGVAGAPLTPYTAVTTDSLGSLVSSTTSSTEIGYLSGVTSGIQSQLNAKVSSFNTRTGVVVPANNDYTWAQVNKATSSLLDLTTRSASDLSSGTLAIAQGGTNNGALAVTAGGVLYTDGSKVVNVGAGSSNQVLTSAGAGVPTWATASSGGGGGNGSPNFVMLDSTYAVASTTNSSAETSVGSWAAYADAGASDPVDMTGGSPAVTISRTTTAGHILNGTASFEVVKTAANKQGEGVSVLVYVPPGYRGQNAQLSIPFSIFSGSIASGDLKLSAYDVTNSALIGVSNSNVTATGLLIGNLVIPSTTAQMRVGFHFATTVTTAVTFDFDDVILGPPSNVGSINISDDWKSDLTFTPSAGFGTVTANTTKYKRVGDTMFVNATWTNGTAAGSAASFSLPSGLTIDSSKLTTTASASAIGIYSATRSGASGVIQAAYSGVVFYDGSDTAKVYFAINSASGAFTKNNGNAISDSSAPFSFQMSIPITQWASSGVAYKPDAVANSWSGYHDSTCSWTRTNTALGDFATDASCALVERKNTNFGTVTGSNDLPKIVFTPSRAGNYFVCAQVMMFDSSLSAVPGLALTDGTTVFAQQEFNVAAVNTVTPVSICGIYNATSTASTTIKIQGQSLTTGTITIGGGVSNQIEWQIFQIDQQMPAPLLVNSVVNTASGVTNTWYGTANLAGAACALDVNSGSTASCAFNATGAFTLTFAANTWSSTPVCTCTGRGPNGTSDFSCFIDEDTTPSSITHKFRINNSGGTSLNNKANIICVGPK